MVRDCGQSNGQPCGDVMSPFGLMSGWSEEPIRPDQDIERLNSILAEHRDKNFVQRILHPNIFPLLKLPAGDIGDYGTHMMSYSTNQNGAMVYPEIIQDPNTGRLVRLGRDEAYDYALKNGQYIPFKTPEEADWFGKNYKKLWGPQYWR